MNKIQIAKAVVDCNESSIPAEVMAWAKTEIDSQIKDADLSWRPKEAAGMSDVEYAGRLNTLAQYYGLNAGAWDLLEKPEPEGHCMDHARELGLAYLRLRRDDPGKPARLIPLTESEVLHLAMRGGRSSRITTLCGMTGANVADCIKTIEHIFLAEGRGPVRREFLPKAWGIK